jgi:hypothetical protein
MKSVLGIGLAGALALPLGGCWVGADPNSCVKVPEARGEAITRKSLKQFLEYTGKTRAPLSGPGGTLNPARLEHVSDSDLVYDGRSPNGGNVYNFHLCWAAQAKFTSTLSTDCGTSNNWTIG